MAKQTVIVSVLADTGRFSRGMKGVEGGISGALKGVGRLALGFAAAGAAIAGTIGAIAIRGGISRALNIEDAQAKLKGLGYDTEQIAAVMDSALGSVRGTAYGLDTAVTAAAGAMAAGVKEGEELERYLTAVADAATIAGIGMDEMSSIFNKVQANGKLTTQELNQLADRGLPVLQWLQEEFGVTAEEMRSMVTSGAVDAETFRQVVEDNIGGAAQAAGDTTRGAFANMRAAMSRWGEALVGGALPLAMDFFNTVGAGFDALTEATVPFAESFWESVSSWMVPALENLRTSFDGITEGIDFSGILAQIWDLSSSLSPVWNVIESLLPYAHELGEAFLEVGQAAGGPLLDALPMVVGIAEQLGEIFGDLATALAPSVVQIIQLLAGTLAELLPVITPLIPATLEIVEALLPLLEIFAELAAVILPPAIDVLSMLLIPALELLVWHFESVTTGIQMTADIIAVLVDWLSVGADWFINYMTTAETTANGLMEFWGAVGTFFSDLWANVTDIFDTAKAIITDIVGTLWTVVEEIFGTAIETVKTLVAGGILIISQLFSGDFAGIADTVRRVWQRIQDLFSGAKTRVQNLVSDLVGRVTGFFGSMMDGARNRVSSGLEGVKRFFQQLPGQLLGFLRSLPQRMADMGRQAIQGLINGIGGAAQWLKNAISNAIGGMLDWAKNLLGIASPSKVFAEIGRWTIQGLEQGLKGPNALNSIMHGLTSDLERSFDPTLEMSTRGGGRFATGPGSGDIHITVNTGVGDPVEIGREVARVLREYTRAGGQVYA